MIFAVQSPLVAQVKQTRRVVILNDLGIISSPGFAEIDQAIFSALQKSPYQIELYHESLEITLFPDEVSQRRVHDEFIRRYSDRKPDVIITVGSASLEFIAKLQQPSLRDIPLIFCAILGQVPEEIGPDMHATGVLGRLHPKETLKAAQRMFPKTEHVVVVGGLGKFDKLFEDNAKQAFQQHESKLDFTYLTNLTMPALLARLKHLPSNTIVYHTAITQDAAGERFVDSAQSVPLVASAANAPIFVMDDVDLRAGTVGGDLVNWSDDGLVAGEMAVRVLNGEKTDDIPIVTSRNVYMFDWRALHRWGITESDLPPGSVVLNKPPNFWQLYKRYILFGVFLLVAQALAIFALLLQRAKRRQTEVRLQESQLRLESIVESAMDAVIAVNEEQQIVVFNEAAEKVFGCQRQDAIGTPLDRFIPERSRGIHSAQIRRFGQDGTAARPMGNSKAVWGQRASGEEFPIEATICLTKAGGKKLFTVIVRDVTQQRHAEEVISSVSRRLIEAHEEERTRIARELHDDINQRLALVAANLSNLNGDAPNSESSTKLRVEEVRQEVEDLGRDVQSLSHRLHSSKLEYLGLAVAAGSFCKEFSERHDVAVEFHYDNIPRGLPADISLCLFRVLQEALQNAAKYSGVTHFEVSLQGTPDEIEMTVHDSGAGFDPEKSLNGHGLGLISMKERLLFVDGVLSIDSRLGHGTTVHASVPMKTSATAASRYQAEEDERQLRKPTI